MVDSERTEQSPNEHRNLQKLCSFASQYGAHKKPASDIHQLFKYGCFLKKKEAGCIRILHKIVFFWFHQMNIAITYRVISDLWEDIRRLFLKLELLFRIISPIWLWSRVHNTHKWFGKMVGRKKTVHLSAIWIQSSFIVARSLLNFRFSLV